MMTEVKSISRQTHAYYRTTIVPALADYCGYESHKEAHRAIKAAFFGMHPDDASLPTMAGMSQEEAGRLIDYAIREAAEMGLVIRDAQKRVAQR